MVRKKDGAFRKCIDYRKLNEVSKKDAYPLPSMDETLQSLDQASWFCVADLSSGYLTGRLRWMKVVRKSLRLSPTKGCLNGMLCPSVYLQR